MILIIEDVCFETIHTFIHAQCGDDELFNNLKGFGLGYQERNLPQVLDKLNDLIRLAKVVLFPDRILNKQFNQNRHLLDTFILGLEWRLFPEQLCEISDTILEAVNPQTIKLELIVQDKRFHLFDSVVKLQRLFVVHPHLVSFFSQSLADVLHANFVVLYFLDPELNRTLDEVVQNLNIAQSDLSTTFDGAVREVYISDKG